MPSNKIPSGNIMAMISPTSLPNAAPRTRRQKRKEGGWSEIFILYAIKVKPYWETKVKYKSPACQVALLFPEPLMSTVHEIPDFPPEPERENLPNTNTGMKPPQGMGIVVATMDIQNWGKKRHQHTLSTPPDGHTHTHYSFPQYFSFFLQEAQKPGITNPSRNHIAITPYPYPKDQGRYVS